MKSIKLEGNGRWESSRIILPEHRERIRDRERERMKRKRIELDDQELQEVGRTLMESMQLKVPVKVRLFDPLEQLEVVGIVERIDPHKQRFMVNGDWFFIVDVEGALIQSGELDF